MTTTSTAGSAAQPTLPGFTATKHTPDPMLAIKGGDDVRATSLRLNRPSKLLGLPPSRSARRPGLAASGLHLTHDRARLARLS